MRFFSLVIPMHHSEETIIKCLDSILSQDFLDYEVILIDDNKSFEGHLLVDDYIKNHKDIQIKYEVIDEIGASIKREIGLEKSSGKYIWFIDSDDEIENNALNIAYNKITNSNCDILRFSYRTIFNDEKTRSGFDFKEDVYEGNNLLNFIYIALRNAWSANSTCWKNIYKRELIKDIGFHKEWKDFEDVTFNCFVYPNAKRIQVTGDILYRYYIRGNSVSHKKRQVLENTIDSYCYIKQYYKDNNFWDLYKNAIITAYGDYFILGTDRTRFGAMYLELRYYDDFNIAIKEIKKYF